MISKKTLKMMDSSMKSIAEGKAGAPIDLKKLRREIGTKREARHKAMATGFKKVYGNKTTMKKSDYEFVWNELFDDNRISSLADDFASIIVKIMRKMKKPSVKKIKGSNFSWRKTDEWNETLDVARDLMVRIVDNSSGCFLDEEFKK